MRHVVKVAAVSALVFASSAAADDGWTSFAGATFAPTPRAEAAPAFENTVSSSSDDEPASVPGAPGAPGAKGDKGDKGDTGPAGPAGANGVNADLCQNLPGVQTVPPAKYNAQRYWSFLPKWEMRFLALNRKHQLVCVTQRWINTHRHGLLRAWSE